MNKKGFTLVELLAVLIVLGLVIGFASTSVVKIMKNSKLKSEEAFVETIKDAVDVYLTGGEAKGLTYYSCSATLDGGAYRDYEYASTTFQVIVNSRYKPINKNSLVNPANNKKCFSNAGPSAINLKIYRHKENHSYYYKIDAKQSGLNNCFKDDDTGIYSIDYISNLEKPGEFKCS